MKSLVLLLWIVAFGILCGNLQAQVPETGETSVDIRFDESAAAPQSGAFPYAPPIEQLFQNPALASGIASGADAINRSVESLMDALFYSLLDNEKNFFITDEAWFNTTLKRDLYTTPSGSYVVMDRFQLGPRYAKELWRVHDVPISLGIDGTVELLQIYSRTDGMRLAEQDDLSPARRWINSWFGLLPLAASVLPPSFNQNELYDPVTQLKTPFSFPLDAQGFYDMPIGSIRSYALSGGVQVGAELGGAQGQSMRDFLDRVGGLTATVPYAVFKRGEHRINVLRRDDHSAWVGVKDLARIGHSAAPFLGTKYSVLRAALAAKLFGWDWVWAGVPISVLPIDLNFEQAIADLFDQVYEYDMRNPAARQAYDVAVKGDFLPSRLRYLDKKEKGIETGVTFHFARVQDRVEDLSRSGPNVAIYKHERKRDHGKAEIEITDQDGKFYVLESSLDVEDRSWDVLVGDEQRLTQQAVEMKVRRVVPSSSIGGDVNETQAKASSSEGLGAGAGSPSEVVGSGEPLQDEGFAYMFEPGPDPYRLTMSFSIQDRYLDTVEYYSYLDDVRFFSGLPLDDVPSVDLRDPELLEERRRSVFFTEPTREVTALHVTPTYLGRFGVQASISFSTAQIERILSSSEDQIWRAFARAYGKDDSAWADPVERASLPHQLQWFVSFFLYPTRLLNFRIPEADAIKEATAAATVLTALRQLETPVERLEAFTRLLDTDYPRHLAHALLELADLSEVPRRVTFSAQPKGAVRHEIKTAFGKLNNRTFAQGPPFPEPTRYARAKAKLANFYLDQPRESGLRPHIASIEVRTRQVPASVRSVDDGADDEADPPGVLDRRARHVFVTVKANGARQERPIKLYVRVEQAGRIRIGKLELAEKVLELTPVDTGERKGDVQTYQFYLTGPLSALSNFMLNTAVGSGDEFLVTMALSRDGLIWSDERSLEFRFDKGRLTPPR